MGLRESAGERVRVREMCERMCVSEREREIKRERERERERVGERDCVLHIKKFCIMCTKKFVYDNLHY